MTIRFLRGYRTKNIGDTTDQYGDGVCAELIRRGVAVEVKQITTTAMNKTMAGRAVAKVK